MMYGPKGSGKSHTMFGIPNAPEIVYKSLKGILGERVDEDGERLGVGTFVQVTVLEIYNEEIYDLLSSANNGGFNFGWSKTGSASKALVDEFRSGPLERPYRPSLEKIDIDISEDERRTRLGSLKKVAINASTKFRHSLTKKGRRNSRVMSVVFDDEHDAEEIQAVDALRQALILEELLPAKHDDYHTLLRYVNAIVQRSGGGGCFSICDSAATRGRIAEAAFGGYRERAPS
ncbi:phosphatidylinositol/phosphatidylcholine transfer protein sfh3 [Phtheirospermum japonicum]|uniref:Phosphatidylinositol/phosphatidylcholine transfer protein sfh3 n=1 Tax=Phtheirospermum japonicum TaxID=374723 RepID=A0A830CNE3_9LAMI|nr:phosphatidylinositol/phosphatidylcholine transfer protein sfh3 [Phtheirospermum japonicum]